MRRKVFLYGAGAFTLFGLGGLGILLINLFQLQTFHQFVLSGNHFIVLQLTIGIAYGAIASVFLLLMLRLKIMDATKDFFSTLLHQFQVRFIDILFLSFCAGVGEEILFRGAIQNWLGIWLTAFIFIALHGYLNPKNKPLALYGIVLLIVSAGFGYLYQFSGIWSAAIAHFTIDIALMRFLQIRYYNNKSLL